MAEEGPHVDIVHNASSPILPNMSWAFDVRELCMQKVCGRLETNLDKRKRNDSTCYVKPIGGAHYKVYNHSLTVASYFMQDHSCSALATNVHFVVYSLSALRRAPSRFKSPNERSSRLSLLVSRFSPSETLTFQGSSQSAGFREPLSHDFNRDNVQTSVSQLTIDS
jgi:hypothetical protein